jgi:4-aminobutyrate aminotransferase-like enzyme
MHPITHPGEPVSDAHRAGVAAGEPRALRTFTPTQAVIANSRGVFHWTADGRRLFDFTSGVLVANLGHNPPRWLARVQELMGWAGGGEPVPLTAYNAITPVEDDATRALLDACRRSPGGGRLQRVLWAASGAEAVQKALWACLARDRDRPLVLATRHGFHGRKGLAGAVTGTEHDPDRDPRVHFIGFPREECRDVSLRDEPFDPAPYRRELDALWAAHGRRIGTLVTEPYLGGGGSYHPPPAYLRTLQAFCREHDVALVLDGVQACFGRCGTLFSHEKYGLEPDAAILGKGLGNGVPVAAAVGRVDLFDSLGYGEASDTWSANPLSCAAVVATLEAFAERDVLGPMRAVSERLEAGLVALKRFPQVRHVRGERGGMVWGVEFADADAANRFVLEAYRGTGGDGVHLLGPLAKTVVRVSPPLVITADEAAAAVDLLHAAAARG